MGIVKRILLVISLLFSSLPLTVAVEPERPNILFIVSDDVGYGDLGCYGATLAKTSHLDRLARDGCRFSDAHSPVSVGVSMRAQRAEPLHLARQGAQH